MNKKVLLFAMLVAAASTVQAKVRLPHLVSDNMVIQQQTDVRLWGWAKPGKKVTATVSWSDQKAEAKADKQGRWLLKVKLLIMYSQARYGSVPVSRIWRCPSRVSGAVP